MCIFAFISSLRRIGTLRAMAFSCVALAAGMSAAAADKSVVVNLDQAKVVQLPPKTSTIIVGNPGIADVTFIKRSSYVILTGKSYGQTNLIALDNTGQALGETQVRVATGPGAMIVQLGTKRVSYSCSPRCQPTLALGDDAAFASEVSGQVQTRNQFAAPSTTAGR